VLTAACAAASGTTSSDAVVMIARFTDFARLVRELHAMLSAGRPHSTLSRAYQSARRRMAALGAIR
jgi:hypothetical protein